MRGVRGQSKDNHSLQKYEHVLRQHFEENTPDTSGINFGAMAERAIQTDANRGSSSAFRQHHRGYAVLRRTAYVTCACLVVAGIVSAGFYFAPNWQQVAYAAVRQIPGFQYVIPRWDVGLLRQASDIQSINASASHRGASIYVTAAYADTSRIVIFLRTSGPNVGSGFLRPETLTLTDQFGHQYSEVAPIGTSSVQPNGAWMGSMDFEGTPNWEQATGLRLTLSVTSMLWSSTRDNSTQTIRGQWVMKWVQPTTSVGQAHSVTIDQVSGGIPVRLSQVQLAPSATVFDLSIAGKQFNSPTFGYVERVSDGKKYELLHGAEPDKIVTPPLERSGKYLLIITTYDNKNVRWALPFSLIN